MTTEAKKSQNFFRYWYTRYLLATELYMVEPWEKVVIHCLISVVFLLFWYFNSTIVVSGISRLRIASSNVEEVF